MYCAGLCSICFTHGRACHANRACATVQSVLFSYPEVLHRSFGSSITLVLDETHWHRINAKVTSHMFSLLALVEGTTVCLEIPLQSPPPPPGDRHLATVSPPHPGDRRALTREFARGGKGTKCDGFYVSMCHGTPPPSHIGVRYLPNVCAFFCSSLVPAKRSSNVLAPLARTSLERC